METDITESIKKVGLEDDQMSEHVQEDETEDAGEVVEDTVAENFIEENLEPIYYPEYQCDSPWRMICSAHQEYENTKTQGFLKGCKWSPDGTCLLTCSDDGLLRLYDLPADLYNSHKKSFQGCSISELSPSLRIKESETIYDYCWHPLMSSWNPETCLYAMGQK